MQHIVIAVPTRNRAKTLQHCVKTCLSQDYENLTVMVSDNCSTDDTSQIMESITDPRLHYMRQTSPLSMSSHFEWLLSKCLELDPDSYIAFIGDDDGYLPRGISMAADMLAKHGWPKALRWAVSAYVWPDCPIELNPNSAHISCSDESVVLQSREALRLVCAYQWSYVNLPGVYGGMVHASVFKEILARCGRIILSHMPDVSLAVNAACVIDEYVYTKMPVSVYGTHAKSNGMSQVTRLTEVHKTFSAENDLPDHEAVANSPCWAFFNTEPLLQAQSRNILPSGISVDIGLAVRVMVHEAASKDEVMRQEILQCARETAERNGLIFDLESINQQNTAARMHEWLYQDPISPMQDSHVTMDFRPLGATNIHEACIVSAALFSCSLTGVLASKARPLDPERTTKAEATAALVDAEEAPPVSPANSTLGTILEQTIALRLAAQSERKQKLHADAKEALEQFLKRQGEKLEKLANKLERIDLEPKPDKKIRFLWWSHQRDVNQQLGRTSQRLGEILRLLLKKQQSESRDLAKVMRTMLAQMDESHPDDDLL